VEDALLRSKKIVKERKSGSGCGCSGGAIARSGGNFGDGEYGKRRVQQSMVGNGERETGGGFG